MTDIQYYNTAKITNIVFTIYFTYIIYEILKNEAKKIFNPLFSGENTGFPVKFKMVDRMTV